MRVMERLLRATAEAEGRHFWFRGFRVFVRPLIARAVAGRSEVRILDCGCGTGANLDMLNRFGFAQGADVSAAGLQLGREAGRTRLVRATVTALPFSSNAFDLVTSFDVLYSLTDHDEQVAVAEMFRLTRPGGYALINVAALPMLRGDHSVLSAEVRRYTRRSLRQLLSAAGFTIVRLTYTNLTLVPPLAALRLAQRWRGLSQEAEAGREISVPPKPINALLTGLLLLESTWVRYVNNPFGSSLLCLARKPAIPDAGPGLR
jgi:SAM-dependent methyltransferase